ncbi:tetratricopeptide repeat protein [Vibrio sp. CK2-1]|uniref:tetratricopeptide repeat protein n=1 Tax=Vibrio sp. CK2-1 TaxID=2912249 RepID=UPI001F0118EE|nr:ammonia-forming cytochrome c nitrite reductase subunit c552 [Vibrio sp. CK2-1]
MKFISQLYLAIILSCISFSNLANTEHASESCASCHQKQVEDWKQSDHFHAMEQATPEISLGQFDGRSIQYLGKPATFSQDDDNELWVDFVDEQGKQHHLNIIYTFGYKPLQQYLFDAGKGKWQFIPFAWDSRTEQEGGQRWFVLHPDEKPNDTFHWTQQGQNWNQMCADCHVTDYKKNFDSNTHSYNPEFSALNVSCNACHGDDSQHIKWAKGDKSIKNMGYDVNIKMRTPMFHKNDNGDMVSVQPLVDSQQVDTCASCHARRAQLQDRTSPQDIVNAFTPSLLSSDLYYPDGQISDEVYVWGSFMQSKMHEKGVTCTNCHNPHSGKLKLPGNDTCTQCHTKTEYDTDSHHKHAKFKQGNQCVDCHMPATTYMQVDPRRDHSFKVPRPDLSISTGSPNACTQCHQDKDDKWAQQSLKTWYPNSKYQGKAHYGTVFHQADTGVLTSSTELSKIAQDANYSDIVRASALSRMSTLPDANAMVAIARAVKSDESLKKLGAIEAAENFPIAQRWSLLSPLLSDDALSIRTEAARVLAPIVPDLAQSAKLSAQERDKLNQVLDEYRQVQAYQSDRGFSYAALGNLAINLNRLDEAQNHFNQAIKVEPNFVPAYVNLADVYRRQNNEAAAQKVLLKGVEIAPDNASLYYSLAMSYVRSQDKTKALIELEQATLKAPDNVRYHYTYSLLLKDQGQLKKAVAALERAYQLSPTSPDLTYALAQEYAELGEYFSALQYAQKLKALVPNNPQVDAFIQQLKVQANK